MKTISKSLGKVALPVARAASGADTSAMTTRRTALMTMLGAAALQACGGMPEAASVPASPSATAGSPAMHALAASLGRGINSLQLVRENGDWRVLSLCWDEEALKGRDVRALIGGQHG